MREAIGVLGALAIVSYIVGMVLVARSEKSSQELIQRPIAKVLMVGAWLLTFVFALLGNWNANSWTVAMMGIAAVGCPVAGFIFSDMKQRWIAASLFFLGFLATSALYLLLMK